MNYSVQNIALIDLNSYMQKNQRFFKMDKYSIIIPLVGLGITFNVIFLPDAYAYIDPGSGSAIIQMLIGTLVGLGIALKVYWHKIKMKFSGFSEKVDKE